MEICRHGPIPSPLATPSALEIFLLEDAVGYALAHGLGRRDGFGQLLLQLRIEQLLRPRRPGHVGPILEGCFAFIAVMACVGQEETKGEEPKLVYCGPGPE